MVPWSSVGCLSGREARRASLHEGRRGDRRVDGDTDRQLDQDPEEAADRGASSRLHALVELAAAQQLGAESAGEGAETDAQDRSDDGDRDQHGPEDPAGQRSEEPADRAPRRSARPLRSDGAREELQGLEIEDVAAGK